MNDIQDYIELIQQSKGKLNSLNKRKDKVAKELSVLITRQVALEEAQVFIQEIAKSTQEQLRYNIVDVVNLCLQTCFPNEYTFDVNFEIKRGRTEASLIFKKDGNELDPISASGGGVVDLCSFALRLSAWSLGHTDNVIILDEPFRFLSKDLQPRAGEIMQKLSKQLGLQMICVTHANEIIENSDRLFEVSLDKGGVSKVIMREN